MEENDIDLKEIYKYLDADMRLNTEEECSFYKNWEKETMYATTEDAYMVDYGMQAKNIDEVQTNTEIQDMNDEEYLERMLFTKADSLTMKRFH